MVGVAVVGVAGTAPAVVVVIGLATGRRDDEHAAVNAATTTAAASIRIAAILTVMRTPTCVWRATPELIVALDERFGEPVDAYVNGSQVWLREDGPGGIVLEWRLHPVAGYRRPDGVDTYDVFSTTALALAQHREPPAPLERLWDGLEAFAAYGDELEPAGLAAAATAALGIAPDAAGLVDHAAIGDTWERTGGGVSIVDSLFQQLHTP